jgi:predicted KAP-like P-loop ATPase
VQSSPQPHYFSTDRPLSNPEDDKLDRNRFTEEIAKSLANWTGHDSLVVSLSGEWGSGKSTIKNFVIHHLGERATTVEFNPWQWSGQDKLLEAFLWQIGAALGKKDIAKQTRKLAKKWKAFASFTKLGGDLSSISQKLFIALLSLSAVTSWITSTLQSEPWIKWVGFGVSVLFLSLSILTALLEKTSTAFSDWSALKEKSLDELRSEIEVEMRKLKKPIVVFIDDIDRLTKDEIKLLIQLVKANAQFPNLVYFFTAVQNKLVLDTRG